MNRYSNKTRLYSGPISDIYKAIDNQTNETIALKIVDTDFNIKPHNFKREISILKSLNHENILPYLNSIQVNLDLVLVTPYYKYDLNQLLKSYLKKSIKFNLEDPLNNSNIYKNEFPLSKINQIFRCIIDALDYLHNEKGIIHRDLKPSNIYFEHEDSMPVLGDFGISYPTRNPPRDELPHQKYLDVCTGIYKPPELCFGVTDYGYEIDIWSLGIILTLLYSTDDKSVIEEEGNDLILINSIFNNFGTPSLNETDQLYWPEMNSDKYHFKNFDFIKKPRRPLNQLLPRCRDQLMFDIFDRMMAYERSKRITAQEIRKLLM